MFILISPGSWTHKPLWAMTLGDHVEQPGQRANFTRGQKYMTFDCTTTRTLIIKSLLNIKCLLEWLVSIQVFLRPELNRSDASHHHHKMHKPQFVTLLSWHLASCFDRDQSLGQSWEETVEMYVPTHGKLTKSCNVCSLTFQQNSNYK